MASNDISDGGVGSLARLLDDEAPSYRCVLSSLDLRGNSIGSKGCKVPHMIPSRVFVSSFGAFWMSDSRMGIQLLSGFWQTPLDERVLGFSF